MSFRHLSLLLALAWMALLFYLSHQPGVPHPVLFAGQDKVLHAGVYGVLAALLLSALRQTGKRITGMQVAASVLIASLFGISDEIHQSFVPGRHADAWDWLADTVGALLAALLLAWLSRKKPAGPRPGVPADS